MIEVIDQAKPEQAVAIPALGWRLRDESGSPVSLVESFG
jgi:hypothetical protein